MSELESYCRYSFLYHMDTLKTLKRHYLLLSEEETVDDDKYFGSILKTINCLLDDLELVLKEEL